jgi:hypothetical protein
MGAQRLVFTDTNIWTGLALGNEKNMFHAFIFQISQCVIQKKDTSNSRNRKPEEKGGQSKWGKWKN